MRTQMSSYAGSNLQQTRCTTALCRTIRRNRLSVKVEASVRARWCLDVRYGCKAEATALVQEWISTIGSTAGLNAANTRLSYGHLGVPESRLEMEVTFNSMSEWESFLSSLPAKEHTAWGQRIRSVIVDGSTMWQVYQSVPLHNTPTQAAAATAAIGLSDVRSSRTTPSAGSTNQQLVITDQLSSEDMVAWQQLTTNNSQQKQKQHQFADVSSQPGTASSPSPAASEDDVPRDWKGEPMKINPGDKLPFKFL